MFSLLNIQFTEFYSTDVGVVILVYLLPWLYMVEVWLYYLGFAGVADVVWVVWVYYLGCTGVLSWLYRYSCCFMGVLPWLYRCITWVVWVYYLGCTGVFPGLYGCITWVVWVYFLGCTGVLPGLYGCITDIERGATSPGDEAPDARMGAGARGSVGTGWLMCSGMV